MMHKSCPIFNGKPFLSPFLFTLLAFTILATFNYKQDNLGNIFCLLDYSNTHSTFPNETTSTTSSQGKLPFAIGAIRKDCDIYSGRWVRDNETRPLYEEHECPYLWLQAKCQGHGRPDKDYMHWRWQPHGCLLPSFDSKMMLENLRGKRMLYAGDSLNGGMFISMVCLLQKVIPDHAKSFVGDEYEATFTAKDYNVTIHFYFAPFLQEASYKKGKVIRKGSIDVHGHYWRGYDIVVFNTYIWWMNGKNIKLLQSGSFDDEKPDIIEVTPYEAYRMAMENMLQWVKENMDLKKTRFFFTSMSPHHGRNIEWGGDGNGNCYNETTLIEDPNFWPTSTLKNVMELIREMFSKSDVPVTFLNITQLSNYRKDAHSSIYKTQWHPLTKEQRAKPSTYADCIHWCSPGLQDTWNELLFAKLFYP